MTPGRSKKDDTNMLWDKLIEVANKSGQRANKKTLCPKVGAIIRDKDSRILISAYHDEDNCEKSQFCLHAEQVAIDKMFDYLKQHSVDLSQCDFYTTIEPCNQRGEHKVPCAQRISTLGFKKVYVGLMDPDPEIYAQGVAYLIHNLGRDRVDYLPRSIREKIWEQNKKFVEQKEKQFPFDFNKIKEKLPIFVGVYLDEERYLRTAHAFARMFEGNKIVWLFPELPSFGNKHIFHAWWAQGIFGNDKVRKVEMFLHKKDWEEGLKICRENGMTEMLLEETEGQNVTVYLSDTNISPGNSAYFPGALLYDGAEISFLIHIMYSKILGMPFCALFICEPKHLALLKDCNVEDIVKELNDAYEKANQNCSKLGNLYNAFYTAFNNR